MIQDIAQATPDYERVQSHLIYKNKGYRIEHENQELIDNIIGAEILTCKDCEPRWILYQECEIENVSGMYVRYFRKKGDKGCNNA